VLSGSRARGEEDEHSDVDVLVIEPAVDDLMKESVRLRRVLRGLGVPIDVLVVQSMRRTVVQPSEEPSLSELFAKGERWLTPEADETNRPSPSISSSSSGLSRETRSARSCVGCYASSGWAESVKGERRAADLAALEASDRAVHPHESCMLVKLNVHAVDAVQIARAGVMVDLHAVADVEHRERFVRVDRL
jgi:predicted nucleotidyltransferase